MAVIQGTITGVSLLESSVNGLGARKAYIVAVDFPAYTGASDTINIAAVGAGIAARTQNGKTNTLRGAVCIGPGIDTANQAVYTGALTVSTDALTGELANAAATELTSSTACTGVRICAVVDES